MTNCLEIDETELIRGSKNFSSFINAYTTYITSYFESTFVDTSTEELLLGEEQVAQSLFLLEKLHMFLFMNMLTYKKHFSLPNSIHPLSDQKNIDLLEKLQMFILQHHFLSEEYRIISEKTISQILSYYYSSHVEQTSDDIEENKEDHIENDEIVTFTFSPVPPPWLASPPTLQ